MDEWPVATFSDLIDRGVLEIGDGYRAKNNELGGDGPIFLRAGLVQDDGIDVSKAERFFVERIPAVVGKMSRPGDVLVTTKGNSTGRTAFISSSLPTVVYSPHLSYWRSMRSDVLVPGYLRFWSQSESFRRQLAGMAASTDMAPYLSLSDQRRLRIQVPPIEVQLRAARILGALDDKIDLSRRMSGTLEAAARVLFQSWFVNKPSAGVTVRGLDEIAVFLNGLAMQRFPPTTPDSLPVIKIAQLRTGDTRSADLAAADIPADYVVRDGDVLFSWSGSLECVLWAGGNGALNQHLFKVTSADFPKWFYYLWIHEHLADFREIAAGKATTMGHIQRHHLSQARVLVPERAVLAAADRVLGPMIEQITLRRVEARTLAETRDSLLPRLVSGDLRMNDADQILETASA